jgi:hypothetical protein
LKDLLLPIDERGYDGETLNDLLRPIPKFTPLTGSTHPAHARNIDLSRHWHPLALFQLFFTWEIMANIVKETNSFALRAHTFLNLTIPELYHYFGCHILLGYYKRPTHDTIWDDRGALNGAPLTKNRFEQITKFLHYKDRGENPVKGPWWEKLDPVVGPLREACQRYWVPGTNLTIDEIMIKFEGRSHGKTTIPGKPIPVGFKLFACGDEGYVWNWEATAPQILEGFIKGQEVKVTIPAEYILTNQPFISTLNPT